MRIERILAGVVLAGSVAFGANLVLNNKLEGNKLEYECVGNVPSLYDFNGEIMGERIEFKICDNTSYLISKREGRESIIYIDEKSDLTVDRLMIGDEYVGTKHPLDFAALTLAKAFFKDNLNRILKYKKSKMIN